LALAERQTDDLIDTAAVGSTTFNLDDPVELEPIVDSEDVGLTNRGETMGFHKKLGVKWAIVRSLNQIITSPLIILTVF
jgi:hypothetical protein